MTLGERLRQIRKSRMITLREVYNATGIDYSNLSQIERGEHGCTVETLRLLANFYNVPIEFLMGTSEEETPKIKSSVSADYDSLDIAIHDASKSLSADDKMQILDYINFIRMKKEKSNEQ